MKKKAKIKKKEDKTKSEIPGFEEVEFICASCGKKVKMLKVKGFSTEGMLCQKCSFGEEIRPD